MISKSGKYHVSMLYQNKVRYDTNNTKKKTKLTLLCVYIEMLNAIGIGIKIYIGSSFIYSVVGGYNEEL